MKQKFFRLIADLRFAIFILLLISFCSIIGTVIEQDQPIETYKLNYPLTNQVFGFLSWDRILTLGLDHVYQTWWFLTLICLFGISLISCTFLQQFPSLKIARRCQFFRTTVQFYRLKISTILNNLSFNKIVSRIKTPQYSIFQQKNIVYCYKGLIGRIAPIIVHFSMILILLGTIIGSLFGFKAQEIVPKTESFHIQNILNNGQLTIVPTMSARINDFWITYTKKKTISQFYSDVSILDNQGNEIDRAKGLVVKDFPKWWTNWTNPNKTNDTFDIDEINFNNKLLIEKRPLFMKHLYSKYKKEFKFHYDRYNYISQKQYNLTMNELLNKQDLDENQKQMICNYHKYNPLLDTDCVMNNICKYMESQISEIKINSKKKNHDKIFDILYNSNIDIDEKEIKLMERQYKKFISKSTIIDSSMDNIDLDSMDSYFSISKDLQKLANLAVYVNYVLYPNSNKNFAWGIFGNGIVMNLHEKFSGKINIPVEDSYGKIEYRGSNYTNKEVIVEL